MHDSARDTMELWLNKFKGGPGTFVLDVGALDVNGSYREMVESRGWDYTGLDTRPGRNVDIVAPPYEYPFEAGEFDLVISGSTMEHVEAIWEWVPELARVLSPGGWLILITHWNFPEHRYPVDCWRIMPDGMRYLLERAGLRVHKVEIISGTDIIGVGIK